MKPMILRPDAAFIPTFVGGKAAALARLVAAGFDVPAFVAILPEAFNPNSLKAEVQTELASAIASLGTGLFAVRSSGREEDGASASHAGQFLSLLEIPPEAVAGAALKVWLSGQTESLKAYRVSHGLSPEGGAPAVIVQRMVLARAAGVAFSADPVSGRRDRIVISAIAGLGDALVGGEADGDDYVLGRPSNTAIAQPATGGVLTGDDLAKLADLATKVEAAQGSPQDIEWAFEGERLYLLQARPITTALRPLPNPDVATNIFDNSNIVESYAGIVSPLTYSFAQYAYARVYRTFVALVGVPPARIAASAMVFENMLGRINGRVYYNLVNWYRALALLPGFALNARFMETMMGVGEPLPPAIAAALAPPKPSGLALVAEYARVAKVGALLLFEAIRLPRTIARFYQRLASALSVTPEAIRAMPLTQLAAEYRRIEGDLLDRWDAPLVNDFLCMIAFGASRKLIEKWAGPQGLELHNAIMIGQGDIISAEPAQRIARMGRMVAGDADLVDALRSGVRGNIPAGSALAAEITAYLAKFGDRCAEELKLESITLDHDPRPLLAAIAAAAGSDRMAATHDHKPWAALDLLLAGQPVKRFLARRIIGWTKNRVRDRENLRFERTRIFGHARRVLVAMGEQFCAHGVLDAPRDVFCLTIFEVLGAIEGFGTSADLRGLVAVRKAEAALDATKPDPPDRITNIGALVVNQAPARASQTAPDQSERARSGTGCSAGVMRARACVIRDPRTQTLPKGDILVARHTDPGWIAIFTNASAIVVERGSLLSHSAIVAREMGIPCVVGVKGVTDWIRDGEMIEIDGATGWVRKLDG